MIAWPKDFGDAARVLIEAAGRMQGASLGGEDGYWVVDGQKVPIRRTRLRTSEKREQRLGSYELFQRSGPLQMGV